MSNFRITFSNPWLLLLLVPLAALTLIPHFRVAKKFRRSRNRVISLALHSIALILCVLLLAGMTFRYEVPNRENQLILLVDVSDSGAEVEEARNEFIQTVLNACDESCEVGIVTFGYGTVYAAPLSADAREVYRQYLEADKPDTGATDIATALEFAAAQITKPATARILLLSDGVETDGRALATVKTLTSGGIGVDAVDMTAPTHEEIQILGVEMPEDKVLVGKAVTLKVTVQNNYLSAKKVSLVVADKGFEGDATDFEVKPGKQTLEVPVTFQAAGLHDLRFSLTAGDDNLSQNNSFQSFLNIPVFENVLVLENQPGESADLAALLGEDFRVTVLNIHTDADRLPTSAKELCAYEQVVLVNIANSDLTGKDAPNGFDQALYDYVYRMGGSLLTVGGQNDVGADGKPTPHAYNRSDLSGTLFQQMLPVQAIDYTPPIAVMLVIDCSGSMSSGRFEAALRGAEECLDSLTERDYCGVMGFSTSSTEHVSVMPVSQKETIRTAIRNLNDEGGGSGGTIFSDAIDQAGRALAAVSVERRHIILVTDGNPSDHLDQSGADDNNYYGRYVDYNYEQSNITMSVITVGMSSGNREQMQKTAERGHGHYYDVSLEDSEGTISINMRQDLAAAAVAELQGGISFVPKIKDQTAVFEGLDSSAVIPALKGYYGTKVKDGARVPLIHDYVPIYAEWDLGAGRVGSFLCDLGGEWSAEFMADAVGRTIVRNISYDLAPDTDLEPDAMDYVLRTDRDNYTTRLDVYTATVEGEKVSVTVMPVSESAKNAYNGNIPVTALGNGISFTFEIKHEGLYRVSIAKADAAGQTLSSVSFCQSFSYSEEYNAFREEGEGAALLAEVAADGGGRVLSDPVEVFSYFVRFLPRETDPRMVFLIIAMVCLLLDVAVRKFKFKWIHEIVRDRRAMKTLGGGGHGAE